MTSRYTDDHDRPTPRVSKTNPHSDLHHTVGQLMVESLNHRKRLETLEVLVTHAGITPGSVPPPASQRAKLFSLARKTFTTTAVIIAALISALKELGFLGH